MEERIRLDGADRFYDGLGLPPVEQVSHETQTIDQLLGEAAPARMGAGRGSEPAQVAAATTRRVVRDEIIATIASIRSAREPKTALHALILRDQQTLGEIAARCHVDPRDIELSLMALVDSGIVQLNEGDYLPAFSISLL